MSGFQLPARASRGKRMRAVMEEEEEGADAEFWNQSFFAEEEVDEDYQAPAVEEEDVVDSDFDEPEDEDGDEDGEEGVERPKRKTLKAPEPKAPPKPKAPKQPKIESTGDEPAPKSRARQVQEEQEPVVIAVPTLRRSTMARVAQAERVRQDKVRPARSRPSKASDWRPMSQAELLQEAARTEVDNLHSLRLLLAMEEETKKKATIIKQVYRGPVVKWVSRRKLLPNAPPSFPTAPAPAAPLQAAPAPTPAPVEPPATATPAAAMAAPGAAVSSGVASVTTTSAPVLPGTIINATPAHMPALDTNAPGSMDVTPSHPSPAPTLETSGAGQAAASPAPDASHANATPSTALVSEANGQVPGMLQGPGAAAAPAAPSQSVQGEGATAGQPQQQQSQQQQQQQQQPAAGDGSAGGQQHHHQQPNKDQNHYEGTLVYELHNMNYPPVWLRRWKAPAPPPPTLCIVTSAPARYRDPATRVGYSNAAAFRRLRGLPAAPPPARPPPPPPPTGRGFNTGSTCLFAGVGSRQALGANALKALAALPPEPQPPPPPSLQQAQVPPMSLAPPMMAMVLEIAQSLR